MQKRDAKDFPQVLLLGNGLNRAFGGKSWEDAIKTQWRNKGLPYCDEYKKAVPYPLLMVLATEDHVDEVLKTNENGTKPTMLKTITGNPALTARCQTLLSLGFDSILTTNYTYELEGAACRGGMCEERYLKTHLAHSRDVEKAEPKYMLHTYYDIAYDTHPNKVWHIHGEARKPSSIVIGHYYYGNLLSRIQKISEARKNRYARAAQEGKEYPNTTWVDDFILGDVYVLGFGYDFSEMDLWWLLNRKARESAGHGSVHFYESSAGNELKHALLRAYGAEVYDLGFDCTEVDYRAFYDAAIADIAGKIYDNKNEEAQLALV